MKYPHIGGPKEWGMLFSKEEIGNDFAGFDVIELKERETSLREGIFRQGVGSVIRFTGIKK